MTWVVSITGFDTSGPGVTTKTYSMGAGLAFTDAAYAPSGFVSWRSPNQKVSVAQAGGVTLSADTGMLVIQNLPNDIGSAGPLDALADWAWQNRAAYLYWISDGTWANRQLVDVAVLQQPFATLVSGGDVQSSLQFQLRDPRYALAVPLQPTKFLGTNAAGQGVEGEADIKGQVKPILYGVVSNISPPRVNASQLIYQVADKSATILCVRDGGLGLSIGTIRGSLASLQANAPTPGTYDSYAGAEGTFFKLGTTPVFSVTCDAREGTQGAARTNLCSRSAARGDAVWSKVNHSVTSDNTAAPDGSVAMDLITRTSTANGYSAQSAVKAASAITYTWSENVKKSSGNFFAMHLQGASSANRADVCFNISTGVISMAAIVTGAFTGASAAIVPDGNGGWWVSLTATSDTSAVISWTDSTSTVSQAVDGTGSASGSAAWVWAAQLEVGAFRTQYIATNAAAATDQDMSNRTHSQIWSRFRQERCGNVSVDLVGASITAADVADPNEVGFWWNAAVTQLDAVNEILTSLSGYEVQGFDLKWSIAKLVAPTGTTVLDFVVVGPTSQLTAKNRAIRNLTRVRPDFAPDGAPPYRCTVNWGRNYTTMSEANFAGAAPQRLRDKFALEYRAETCTNTAIWDPVGLTGPWMNAPELKINTAYQPGNDSLTAIHAKAEAGRLEALYGANKGQYQLDFTPRVTDQILAGMVCSIAYPQLGLSGAPLFTVLQSALVVEKELARMSLVLGLQT